MRRLIAQTTGDAAKGSDVKADGEVTGFAYAWYFDALGTGTAKARAFLDAMIHHHQDVQKSKGRNGKQAWIRRSENDRWYADVLGHSEQVDAETNAFVHQYRIRPLMSFLQTLGHVAG